MLAVLLAIGLNANLGLSLGPADLHVSAVPRALLDSTSAARVPAARPAPAHRKFNSSAINQLIDDLVPKFQDPDLAQIFSNCLPNTLDTTVLYASEEDSFVITGDIPAMWLRDSTNQVMPYIQFAGRDPVLKAFLKGLVNRQLRSVLLDEYANAFNIKADGGGHQDDVRRPPMTKPVFEGKYELDSLAAAMKLSYHVWQATNDHDLLSELWLSAMEKIVATITIEQQSTIEDGPQPAYFFHRPDEGTYPRPNRPANRCGLSKCGFRPSDDMTDYPHLIPANAMAAVELEHVATMANMLQGQRAASLRANASSLAVQIRSAVEARGFGSHPRHGKVYAYEVDCFGNSSVWDDSNIPSLLSLPYLGYVNNTHPLYVATRGFLLSADNPSFYQGTVGSGIGSPHTPKNYIWPMAVALQAITSDDDKEITACLKTLKNSALATGFMHESFNKDNAAQFTRPWFAWANSLFGELIIKLADTKPHLIFKNNQ